MYDPEDPFASPSHDITISELYAKMRTAGGVLVAGALLAAGLAACDTAPRGADVPLPAASGSIRPTTPTPEATATIERPKDLTDPALKDIARRVTSGFENATVELQYDYAEVLDDGRGYTVGFIGFTSGEDDLTAVVERYLETTAAPNSPVAQKMKQYLKALKASDGDSIAGLEGFDKAWKEASHTDPALNQAQEEIYDEWYFQPAMKHINALGIKTPAVQLAVLDAMIQHGDSDDPGDAEYKDSLTWLLTQAGPVQNGDEIAWAKKFLEIRRKDLMNPNVKATAAEWRDSVGRIYTLLWFLDNHPDLKPPFQWNNYDPKGVLDAEDHFECSPPATVGALADCHNV